MQHVEFSRDKKAGTLTRQSTMPGELWGDLPVKSDRYVVHSRTLQIVILLCRREYIETGSISQVNGF